MAKGRATAIILDELEKRELMALTRKHGAPQSLADRARIILAAASGLNNREVAAKTGVCAATAGTWRHRFAERRMDGLHDEPRPGAPREIGDDEIALTIRKTLETRPQAATHWSLRTMAREIGHAPSTVHRIWRAFGLQPQRRFKLCPGTGEIPLRHQRGSKSGVDLSLRAVPDRLFELVPRGRPFLLARQQGPQVHTNRRNLRPQPNRLT